MKIMNNDKALAQYLVLQNKIEEQPKALKLQIAEAQDNA